MKIPKAEVQREPEPRRRKGWHCPACELPVNADTLLGIRSGMDLKLTGKWYVKGRCPNPLCGALIQFTKHGAAVLERYGPVGAANPVVKKMVPMTTEENGTWTS